VYQRDETLIQCCSPTHKDAVPKDLFESSGRTGGMSPALHLRSNGENRRCSFNPLAPFPSEDRAASAHRKRDLIFGSANGKARCSYDIKRAP
jgi:hypothetical protein